MSSQNNKNNRKLAGDSQSGIAKVPNIKKEHHIQIYEESSSIGDVRPPKIKKKNKN